MTKQETITTTGGPFNEDLDMIRDQLRRFIQTEVTAKADAWEEEGMVPRDVLRRMGDLGVLGMRYDEKYGGAGLDVMSSVVLAEEVGRSTFGGFAATVLVHTDMASPHLENAGTPEQKARWMPSITAGEKIAAVAVTEPGAGSDVAGLATRAVRDGDEYVVNGSKIWSTRADCTEWGILLVRTADDGVPQKGITYLLLDMATPGIEVRPIHEMTGGRHFNETFFTDVRIPVDLRVGDENEGWRLAKVTLANERVSLSEGGVLWGLGPDDDQVLDKIRSAGCDDPVLRQRIADLYTEMVVLRLLNQRIMSAQVSGGDPGPLSSVRKAIGDEHGQKAMGLVKDLEGTSTLLDGHFPYHEEEDVWAWGHYFSRALTIGGGTSEVQRNIIGERLLGLPREPRP